jgi:hypothetical protein
LTLGQLNLSINLVVIVPYIILEFQIFFAWKKVVDNVIKGIDNFRTGLHSYLGAGAKTSLGVIITKLKH